MPTQARQARLAFVGCGAHATRTLYPALTQTPSIDLVAVCDLKEGLARDAARRFGARQWYTDLGKMLSEEEPEGVLVCGPPQMHYEVGLEVVRRGVPLFVEKPSALNADLARELAQAAQEHGTWGQVAFMKRHAVAYRITTHIVEQPQFGPVSLIQADFTQGPYPAHWGVEPPALAFLTGQVVHIFDLIRHFGGEVAEVHARYVERSPEQFAFAVSVLFASGAVGLLNLNSLDAKERWRDIGEHLAVSGLERVVTVDDMLYVRLDGHTEWFQVPGLDIGKAYYGWQPTGPPARKTEEYIGYQPEVSHFAECVLAGKPAMPSLWDGAAALDITAAVWESVQQGGSVAVRGT